MSSYILLAALLDPLSSLPDLNNNLVLKIRNNDLVIEKQKKNLIVLIEMILKLN